MIQDIYPHKFDNQFKSEKNPRTCDTVFCFKDNEILVNSEELAFPRVVDFKKMKILFFFLKLMEKIYIY